MVEVVVRPDDGADVFASDAQAGVVGVQECVYVCFHVDFNDHVDDLDCGGWEVFPVLTHSQVEQDVLVAMGDEETVDGCIGSCKEFFF